MHYFDTSFIVPLSLPEDTSEQIRNFLQSVVKKELAVSELTRVEFASTIAREVRMGKLDATEAHVAISRFETMLKKMFFDVLLPDKSDYEQARNWLGRFGFKMSLKTQDALHLAIAKNRNAEIIYSLDKKMIEVAEELVFNHRWNVV